MPDEGSQPPTTAPSTGHDELARLDATETANLIRGGKLSMREACEAAMARIDAVNSQLNAVVRTRYVEALAEIEQVRPDAPFAGVPVLIKDVVIAGEPFFNGSQAYAALDWRPPETDVFVERMRGAGLVILGETNIPEFTSAPTTESRLHGPCRNPWDVSRSAGGSSGGSAAAVAALMTPAAQSSDGGGSSRIPASANGLFTIKTSRGRTPLGPAGGVWMDITASKSFVTRSVRDFAGLVDALGGPDAAETLVAPPLPGALVAELHRRPERLRIGMTATLPGNLMPLDPEAALALADAAKLLAELGHEVVEAAPETFTSAESLEILQAYWPLKVAMRSSGAERALGRPLGPDDLEPGTYRMLEYARGHSMMDFALTLQRIRAFTSRSLAWWRDFDLLLTPATGLGPPPLGAFGNPAPEGRAISLAWMGVSPFANITGQPAASVPLYWTPEGLPIGAQLVADAGRDDLLVRIGAQLEAARPWRDRTPPVHA